MNSRGSRTDLGAPGGEVLRATRHFDQFPPTRLSVGYRIGQRTFAAPSPIGCRAPFPAVAVTTANSCSRPLGGTFMTTSADGWGDEKRTLTSSMISAGSRQFVEQRLCLFEIGRVEAFGEPAVDRREEIAGFGAPALVAPEPGEARGGAQFPELGLLLLGRCSGLCDTVPRRPRNALAAAATGLCAGSAPLRTSARLSFRRSAKHRPTGSPPLQLAPRSHMPQPGGRR